jgi:hypothetical protein
MPVVIDRADPLIEVCNDIGHGSSFRVELIPRQLELVQGDLQVGLAIVPGRRELACACSPAPTAG